MDWLIKHSVSLYKDSDNKLILFSPGARKIVVTTEKDYMAYLSSGSFKTVFDTLLDYTPIQEQSHLRCPDDYYLLTILPNNACNFNCSYCYSATGRNNSHLSLADLKATIDYFFDTKPNGFNKPMTISFMGGGEPFLSWNLVMDGISYAKEKAMLRSFVFHPRIITNGSMLDNKQIQYLHDNKVDMSVSFEILKDIQNRQRKHYDIVKNNILRLCEADISVQINSTVTASNVTMLEEMIEVLHLSFPSIKAAMFEPVTGQSLFRSTESMAVFYRLFIEHFFSARKKADEYGLSLTCFAYLRAMYPIIRACPGELCLTADGNLTGCYCVSSPKDALFERACYGKVSNRIVYIDKSKFARLINDNVLSHKECEECKVKWSCGGGCWYQYKSYDEEYQRVVCDFTRSFVEQMVLYKVHNNPSVDYPYVINI